MDLLTRQMRIALKGLDLEEKFTIITCALARADLDAAARKAIITSIEREKEEYLTKYKPLEVIKSDYRR